MFVFSCDTVNDAWEHMFKHLNNKAQDESNNIVSRDGTVGAEEINVVIEINDPTRNIVTSPLRKLPLRYMIGEFLWFLSRNRRLREIQKFTKGWNRMSDDGVNLNSNYGFAIHDKYDFDQWEFVKQELTDNSASRRAVIHIKEPRDLRSDPTSDVNCGVYMQFFIRDEKLYLSTYMRSNDVWMGFPYDAFYMTSLLVLMSMELGLDIGTYTHYAGSMHLYLRNVKDGRETAGFEDEALFLPSAMNQELVKKHDVADLDYVEFD